MRGDGGQADDEDDPEAAVAGEAGEGAVVEVGALELGGASAERVQEGVPGADCGGLVLKERRARRRGTRTLADEGPRRDDGEADPQPPDHAAQQRDDLVAEQRGEGDDEEDGDGDEPAGGEVVQFLGEGAQLGDDLVVVEGDVDCEDEDGDADDVPGWGCQYTCFDERQR